MPTKQTFLSIETACDASHECKMLLNFNVHLHMMVYKCLDASNIYIKKMLLHAKVVQLFNKTLHVFYKTILLKNKRTLNMFSGHVDYFP